MPGNCGADVPTLLVVVTLFAILLGALRAGRRLNRLLAQASLGHYRANGRECVCAGLVNRDRQIADPLAIELAQFMNDDRAL